MESVLTFNKLYKPITKNESVDIPQFTNSYTIINLGTNQCVVDSVFPLNPGIPGTNNGEALSFGGNRAEIFKGRLDISFPNGAIGNVLIVFKIYLPGQIK